MRTAGAGGGAGAFSLDARAENDDAFEEEADDDDGVGAGDNDADQAVDADLGQQENDKKCKLHSLPEEAAPLGLIANLSLRNTTPRKSSMGPMSDAASPATADAASPNQHEENENDVGVASATYFLPGSLLSALSCHSSLAPRRSCNKPRTTTSYRGAHHAPRNPCARSRHPGGRREIIRDVCLFLILTHAV